MNTRAPSRRYDSVRQDWRAILPELKADFFEIHTRELEKNYIIFSIALNEALDYRRQGLSSKACQVVGVASELCSLFALRVSSVLHSMRQRARHFGVVPNLAPLEPANFVTSRGQHGARFSSLLSRVLLSERAQFLHKVLTLEQIVDDACDSFIASAKELAEGDTGYCGTLWQTLDLCHFDLNTCLRETNVLFKSFLVVLPEEHLSGLDFTIRGLARARPSSRYPVASFLSARRIGAVAGK